MKKIFIFAIIVGMLFFTTSSVFSYSPSKDKLAQEASQMARENFSDDHTAIKEAEGKAIWQKIQNKEINCGDLSEDDFGALGEYFMGQMMGNSHSYMNQMMVNMLGKDGEEQMHRVIGKRLSGCDPSASFQAKGLDFMPMMSMMMGGWQFPFSLNPTMRGFGSNFPLWSSFNLGILTLIQIVWLIVGVLAIVWLLKQIKK